MIFGKGVLHMWQSGAYLGLGSSAALRRRLIWEGRLQVQEDTVRKSSIWAGHGFTQCWILHQDHARRPGSQTCLTVYLLSVNAVNNPQQNPHMIWSRPTLNRFWSEMSVVIGSEIIPNTGAVLSGVCVYVSASIQSFSPTKDLAEFSTLLARKLISLQWKSSTSLTYTHWKKEVLLCFVCFVC